MRHPDEIIRETYEQNRTTFSDTDRTNARRAWDIYMREINGAGLRWEFDYRPSNIDKLRGRLPQHRSEIDRLKNRTKRFEEFIELIENLGDRHAVTLNPLWWNTDDAAETISRVLDPQAIVAYRAFHAALVTYFDELSKESPDWTKIAEFARQVAYTVNGREWREIGASAPEHGVTDFATRWFLEAILTKPRKSVD